MEHPITLFIIIECSVYHRYGSGDGTRERPYNLGWRLFPVENFFHQVENFFHQAENFFHQVENFFHRVENFFHWVEIFFHAATGWRLFPPGGDCSHRVEISSTGTLLW